MDFRCIHCGFRIKSLIVQYSSENIRLVKCDNCRAIADGYIECEIMILLIDLILHEPKAYRHLIYNALNRPITDFKGLIWLSTVTYLFLDGYRLSILMNTGNEEGLSVGVSSLVWKYVMVLLQVVFTNFMFFLIFLLGARILLKKTHGVFKYNEFLVTILISSFLKIFLLAVMVWEFPRSVIFVIDIFVLSSNMVALKVVSECGENKSMVICLVAHSAKFLANYWYLNGKLFS